MKAIVNTNLVLEDGIIFDGTIVIDGRHIVDLGEKDKVKIPHNAEIIDACGNYVAPGLIDIHNHGSEDYLFIDEPTKCSEHFLMHGVTTVLPTLYQDLTLEQILQGAEKIKKASIDGAGRIILGLYMEGPFMSGRGSNLKNRKWDPTVTISEEMFKPLVDGLKDFVKVWAIDPHRDGIENVLSYVRKKFSDVVFTLGHSRATFEECRSVRKYGITLQTHHGDSGKIVGLAQGTMGAGCDEYALYTPEIYTEIICDYTGIHVVPDMIKMVVKTKSIERVVLISDSMPKSGNYTNNEKEGVAYGPDLNYDYEGKLSGSHLTLDSACKNFMRHTGYGICHAVRCASYNPAKVLGIDNTVGSLEKGKLANIIIIDDKFNVKKVFLLGEQVK